MAYTDVEAKVRADIAEQRRQKNETEPATQAQVAYMMRRHLVDPFDLKSITKAQASQIIDKDMRQPLTAYEIERVMRMTWHNHESASKLTQRDLQAITRNFYSQPISENVKEVERACRELGMTKEDAEKLTRREYLKAMEQHKLSKDPEAPTQAQLNYLNRCVEKRGIDISGITTKSEATEFIREQKKIDAAEAERRRYSENPVRASEVIQHVMDNLRQGTPRQKLPAPFIEGKMENGTPFSWQVGTNPMMQDHNGKWKPMSIDSEEGMSIIHMCSDRSSRIFAELDDIAANYGSRYSNDLINNGVNSISDAKNMALDYSPSVEDVKHILASMGYSDAMSEDPSSTRTWETLERHFLSKFVSAVEQNCSYTLGKMQDEENEISR